MTTAEIIQSQLLDLFRIALLVGLVLTTFRTRANTGLYLPLIAGIVFVAAIIPTTIGANAGGDFWTLFGLGLISNVVILAILLGALTLFQRLRGN